MHPAILRYQVLEGEIKHLRTEDTHVHYLENTKQQQAIAGGTAILQVAMEQAVAVNSVQATAYEGDPVDGFIMEVEGKTVRGSFWRVTFKDGDRVQIIGHEIAGISEAVAVAKPDERIIWMQPHCERGTQAQRNNLLKCSCWFILFMYFCALLISVFSDGPPSLVFVTFTISIPILLFLTVGMSWGDFMSFAREMNAVGQALGLSEPEKTDLFHSTKQARQGGRPELPLGVYYF